MTLSKINLAIIEGSKKGYKVVGDKIYNPKNKILKYSDNNRGYPVISVSINESRTTIPVHKLVAYQKYGSLIFQKNIQVRHLDGNKCNFEYSNIQLGTPSDNRYDIPKQKRKEIAFKANLNRRKLSKQQADELRNTYLSLHKKRGFITNMARFYNVSRSLIKHLIHNKTYLQ